MVERTRAWYLANAHRYDRRHPGLPGDREFYASLCRDVTVLEVGAGTGRVTEAIAEVARTVIAVDIAPPMLTIARQRLNARRNVTLVLADAADLPFVGRFDRIVLAYRTLQHLDAMSRRRFWGSARTLLAAGGIVAFDTWHGPPSTGDRPRDVQLTAVTTAQLFQELAASSLQVLGVRTSFGRHEDTHSLTRVWLCIAGT